MRIQKADFLYLIVFFIHISKSGILVLIPSLYFFLVSFVNKVFKFKPAFYLLLYILYSSTLFLMTFDLSFGNTASLIDIKPIVMLLTFPFFVAIVRNTKTIDLFTFGKSLIAVNIIYICFSLLMFGTFGEGYLIRGDAGIILSIAVILLLPFSIKELQKSIFWILLALCLFALYKGRSSILVLSITLIYFVYFAWRHKLINRHLMLFYSLLPIIFSVAASYIFFARAQDIMSSWEISAVESEARIMAFYVFYEVLQDISFFEIIFGKGFGIDYSSEVECNFRFMCLHMSNIIAGNNGIYPTIGFHNELIRIFLTTGILGLIIFFMFIKFLWFQISREYKFDHIVLILRLRLIIIFFAFSMFSHGIIGTTITGFLLLSVLGIIYKKILTVRYV